MFKAPFSFEGRIRRTEFCISVFIYWVVAVALSLSLDSLGLMSFLAFLIVIPAVWFILAQGTKRCHDRGNTGWYMFIPFYSFWMMFADSEYGRNEFGPNPKGIGNEVVESAAEL